MRFHKNELSLHKILIGLNVFFAVSSSCFSQMEGFYEVRARIDILERGHQEKKFV